MDIADQAEHQEEMARNLVIKSHQNRRKEQPEFDNDGNRICLECGDDISEKRIQAIDAVRCVFCQQKKEQKERLWS
jgi:DnaK suppressor protein